MNSKNKVVEVKKELASKYINTNEANEVQCDDDGNVWVAVRCSDSVYTGIQSSIAFLYCQCGVERPEELKANISLYCKGSKRLGKSLKQGLVSKISEGKKQWVEMSIPLLPNRCGQVMKKNTSLVIYFLYLIGKFFMINF